MKKLLALVLSIGIIFSVVGCAECIGIEYRNVEVTIIDKFHRSMWLQPIMYGKVRSFITHPAVYRITVVYEGVEYAISGVDTYNKYKDHICEKAIGVIETSYYDDGTTKSVITRLE